MSKRTCQQDRINALKTISFLFIFKSSEIFFFHLLKLCRQIQKRIRLFRTIMRHETQSPKSSRDSGRSDVFVQWQ